MENFKFKEEIEKMYNCQKLLHRFHASSDTVNELLNLIIEEKSNGTLEQDLISKFGFEFEIMKKNKAQYFEAVNTLQDGK